MRIFQFGQDSELQAGLSSAERCIPSLTSTSPALAGPSRRHAGSVMSSSQCWDHKGLRLRTLSTLMVLQVSPTKEYKTAEFVLWIQQISVEPKLQLEARSLVCIHVSLIENLEKYKRVPLSGALRVDKFLCLSWLCSPSAIYSHAHTKPQAPRGGTIGLSTMQRRCSFILIFLCSTLTKKAEGAPRMTFKSQLKYMLHKVKDLCFYNSCIK